MSHPMHQHIKHCSAHFSKAQPCWDYPPHCDELASQCKPYAGHHTRTFIYMDTHGHPWTPIYIYMDTHGHPWTPIYIYMDTHGHPYISTWTPMDTNGHPYISTWTPMDTH